MHVNAPVEFQVSYHSIKDSFPRSYLVGADAGRRERLSWLSSGIWGLARYKEPTACAIPASSGEHCHHQLLLARHGSSFVSLLPVHPLSDQRGIPAIPAVQCLANVEIACRLCFSNFRL